MGQGVRWGNTCLTPFFFWVSYNQEPRTTMDATAVLEAPNATATPLVTPNQKLADFRAQKTNWELAVFVGCGGNYYYMRPYLEVRLRGIAELAWVDPDSLEPKNAGRQWPHRLVNEAKVTIAANEWPSTEATVKTCIHGPLSAVNPTDLISVRHHKDGVLLICLPDNDAARLDTMRLAEDLLEWGLCNTVGVVVAGTDINRGQAYWGLGIRDNMEPTWVHDWRTHHTEDVKDDGGRAPTGCGQRPSDNMLTASAAMMALEDLLAGDTTVHEYYWTVIKQHTKFWEKPV